MYSSVCIFILQQFLFFHVKLLCSSNASCILHEVVEKDFLQDQPPILTINTPSLLSDLYFGSIDFDSLPSRYFLYFEGRRLLDFLYDLQPGVVIFVQVDWLNLFFNIYYQIISVPFILISGGERDDPIPNGQALFYFLVPDSKIIHWYGQNCENNPDRKRFTCLPLGVFDNTIWTGGLYSSADVLKNKFSSKIVTYNSTSRHQMLHNSTNSDVLAYFAILTHSSRANVKQLFCGRLEKGLEWVGNPKKIVKFVHKNANNVTSSCGGRVSAEEVFSHTLENKFVLSPRGRGPDCFRTWETLYLGAYPIVQKSALDELFTDLPVLIVNEWEDVTAELLSRTFLNFSKKSYEYQKLYPSYWNSLFHSHGYKRFRYERKDGDYGKNLNELTLKILNLTEGDLIKGEKNKITYAIRNLSRSPIFDVAMFNKYGWDDKKVKKISEFNLSQILTGPNVV